VTSPHTPTLLNEPVDASAPRAPQHTRSVTHVVAQPQVYAPQPQAYAPQPQYVQAPQHAAGGGSVVGSLLLGLIVILVGAVALVGGYYITKQAAPSNREAQLTQGIAMREGFRAGRQRGIVAGHSQAVENASTTSALRIAAARQQAYATAFKRGERAGRKSYTAPRSTSYRGGYSAPRYSGARNADVIGAFGQAQALANATGAAVDVEIYR
jgi:hypothetical protein